MILDKILIDSISFQKHKRIYQLKIHKELQEEIKIKSRYGTILFNYKNKILSVSFEEFINWEDIPIDFITIDLKIPDLKNFKTILHQGYNNWTQTYEVPIEEEQKNISKFIKWLLAPFGEYTIIKYIHKFSKHLLRSHFYTYLRDSNNQILMFCSLNEKISYTIFQLDYNNSILRVIKDFQNFTGFSKIQLFSLYINYGEYYQIFDKVSDLLEQQKEKLITGYTSWYYHNNNISFQELVRRIEFYGKNKIPIDVFQIDDGYQKRVGDWLHLKADFDGRMKDIAQRIKSYNIKPGIWIAPFICEKKSYLFQYHNEWLMRDRDENLVIAGFNPLWSGKFYALNIYHPDFQEYLKYVLNIFIKEWRFEFLKLDFLYAASIYPIKRHTRAMQMQYALDLIHNAVNWKKDNIKLLGCGIPFSHAFGNVNYTRIGSDVEEKWENYLKNFNFLERVSTFNSLNSTIYRHAFNTKNFLNDPDVFYLRDNFKALKKKDLLKKINLTEEEKLTLLFNNQIFGGVSFTSDPIESYDTEKLRLYKKLFPFLKKNYTKFIPINELAFEIHFQIKKSNFYLNATNIKNKEGSFFYIFFTNLSEKEVNFLLEENQLYFVSFPFQKIYGEFIFQRKNILLKPHHSLLLYKPELKSTALLGSDGHIFPLSEIQNFVIKRGEFKIELEEYSYDSSCVYIYVPQKEIEKYKNKYQILEWNSIHYIKETFKKNQ